MGTMNTYAIIDNCRNNDRLRSMFFDFTRRIYPNVDFVDWYARGFWHDEYTPHVIVEKDRIVANVSTTRMKLIVDNREVNGVQIGTVGTIPEYRGRGLSRVLMEHVVDKYRESTELIFLFADDDVLDFYPKFGFRRCHASLFTATSSIPSPAFSARRLDIHSQTDTALIESLLQRRMTLTGIFGALDYAFITHWHLLNIFAKDLLYLEKDNAIIIARERNAALHVYDVICSQPIALPQSLGSVMTSSETESIVYYFPPDRLPFGYDEATADDDCPLFVRGDFAAEGTRFKFPTTAMT